MEKIDRIFKEVQQSSTGIRAIEISKRLKVDKSTVHRYLTSLDYMGKVESRSGLWFAKTGEQTIKPLEKEIEILLPMPKNEWRRMAFLEAQAQEFQRLKIPLAEDIRILLEKFKETRTIKVTGKNVDELDLEKAANLIRQANERSIKVSLRGLFKGLKKPYANKSQQ